MRDQLWLFILAVAALSSSAAAQTVRLESGGTAAEFGPRGLISVADTRSGARVDLIADGWSLQIDGALMRSSDVAPRMSRSAADEVAYDYDFGRCRIEALYRLDAGGGFVTKTLRLSGGAPTSRIGRVAPWDVVVRTPVSSDYVPAAYGMSRGLSLEASRQSLAAKDFGDFLRFRNGAGALFTVENPFLDVKRKGQAVSIAYEPEMEWRQSWGPFESDPAAIGAYRLTGRQQPREMIHEWHLVPAQLPNDGMDAAEVAAFTGLVRDALIDPAPLPISVEVGWTLNDYQIDVATAEGRAEYRRIIDMAAALGIRNLLYAPTDSHLGSRAEAADSWHWENLLWLGLGEKVRAGEWDPARDPVPSEITEMVSYARSKGVGLLAYVYPSVPFAGNPSWIAHRWDHSFASLASRDLQDLLIRDLIAFQRRTGIAGYSFDYTYLDLPGSTSYAQWRGWMRVIESVRRALPSLVIDGRQTYQMYGPWSWLAGSYPHPTGNDEQPESFRPFPDLHLDRLSGDRARFVNYWYRNYQFAPEEIVPGYATHQTDRYRNITSPIAGQKPDELVLDRFRPRDWDELGFKYSFLSSIATASWNTVVGMIPARDPEEARYFPEEDKAWIRHWLAWAVENKNILLHTRSILGQPALGKIDGTAAIAGDHGYVFLFNPNYRKMATLFTLDDSIGLHQAGTYILKELYPREGRVWGHWGLPGSALWGRGSVVSAVLDGTSATVLQIMPAGETDKPLVFDAGGLSPTSETTARIDHGILSLDHAAGEFGAAGDIGVLLPPKATVVRVNVNGRDESFIRKGDYVFIRLQFAGSPFSQAQEIPMRSTAEGRYSGTFAVPASILRQLAERRAQWPIAWTAEDDKATWLNPSRLLIFIQTADPDDSQPMTAALDGRPLTLRRAYSSTRVAAACFLGYYADLSAIAPDVPHRIEIAAPSLPPQNFQGIFFDNVTPEFTESIAP